MFKSFQFSLVLKGILMAAITALLLSLAFGILLSFTKIPESDLSLSIIFGFSIMISSFITSNQTGTKGLYYGLSIGLGFIILVLILSAILWSDTPSWVKISERTILALTAGGIGGILGVLVHRP